VSIEGQRKVERDLRRLEIITQFSPESIANLDLASDLVASGTYLVFFGNHTHHGNVGVFDSIISALNPRPQDVYIAVSRTLSDQGQEDGLVTFSQNYQALRNKDRIHQVPFIVEKDVQKMKDMEVQGLIASGQVRKVLEETVENRSMVFETLNEDAMFMLFPETTTEGGVYDPKIRRRKGMLKVTTEILPQLYSKAQKAGRDIAFVPVSINGFGEVLEPRSRKVHNKAKLRIGMHEYLHLDPDTFGFSRLIRANIGEPIGFGFLADRGVIQINRNRLQVVDYQDFTDVLMFEVARKLDPELQGYYRIAA